MKEKDSDLHARRSVMTGVGVAIAGLAAAATSAHAQAPAAMTGFRPARHPQDAWLDQLPGSHRVFIDSATPRGGAEALLFARNLYRARETAYADEPADFAIVVCFRHSSTPFGYNDAIWAKYGQVLNARTQMPDPATGEAPKVNPMNSAAYTTLPNVGVTVDAMGAKGTQFAICLSATQFFAREIARQTGGQFEAIRDELVANGVDNSRFVSAGVMALTRAQEYGYSLLYAG